jgi:hypothetical protein
VEAEEASPLRSGPRSGGGCGGGCGGEAVAGGGGESHGLRRSHARPPAHSAPLLSLTGRAELVVSSSRGPGLAGGSGEGKGEVVVGPRGVGCLSSVVAYLPGSERSG